MAKFRKKPVVIEAKQWFKPGDHSAVIAKETYYQPMHKIIEFHVVKTLEGEHVVTPGDWIITGVKGEHYPCKPDIFEMTYETVEEDFLAGAKACDLSGEENCEACQ